MDILTDVTPWVALVVMALWACGAGLLYLVARSENGDD